MIKQKVVSAFKNEWIIWDHIEDKDIVGTSEIKIGEGLVRNFLHFVVFLEGTSLHLLCCSLSLGHHYLLTKCGSSFLISSICFPVIHSSQSNQSDLHISFAFVNYGKCERYKSKKWYNELP